MFCKNLLLAIALTICYAVPVCAQQPSTLPKPLEPIPQLEYPKIALQARIQGVISLEVTVEAGHVTSVVTSGQPMLAKFAADAIRGWRFAPSVNQKFASTFSYEFRDGLDAAMVTENLPESVTIIDDPGRAFREYEAARPKCVTLSLWLDGKQVPAPSTITVGSSGTSTTIVPTDGCFWLPEGRFSDDQKLFVMFEVPGERVAFGGLRSDFFTGPWIISIPADERPRGWRAVFHPANKARQSCRVTFDFGEPGTGMITSPCAVKTRP